MFEEKKVELQTKVIEIYEASPAEIKVRIHILSTRIARKRITIIDLQGSCLKFSEFG